MRTIAMMDRQSNTNAANQHLNGAALVDEQGREIPITEEMINQALHALENDFFLPQIELPRRIIA